MGVFEGKGQLHKALQQLQSRWMETRVSWDDAVAREFEQKHLLPLEQEIKKATAAMDHMAIVLTQIRRECQ